MGKDFKMARRIRSAIAGLAPLALIERHRRRMQLRSLGFETSLWRAPETYAAAKACRVELWPESLKRQSGWTLVDVGANTGDFIRAALRFSKPGSVIAFEPLRALRDQLECLRRDVSDFRLVTAAVGAAPAVCDLHLTRNDKMTSLLQPDSSVVAYYEDDDYEVIEKAPVPVVTLDTELDAVKQIGLLKVDVQGYEMEVFKGARETLRKTDTVLLEVNYAQHYKKAVTFSEIHAFLSEREFVLYGISEPYGSARPLWADAAYVRRRS